MTRDDVIQLFRVMSDSYISEAQNGKVPENEIWGVYHGTLIRGVERFGEYARKIAETPDADLSKVMPREDGDDGEPSAFEHLTVALLQVLTAAGLLLEMMPVPRESAVGVTIGRDVSKPN